MVLRTAREIPSTHAPACLRGVAALLAVLALACGARAAQEDGASPSAPAQAEPAELVVWNRRVATLRATIGDSSPAERAQRASERILGIPAVRGKWKVEQQRAQVGEHSGVLFLLNGHAVFGLAEQDVDVEAGETLEQAAAEAEARLREVTEARTRQRHWPLILRGVLVSIALTAALAVVLIGTGRIVRRIRARVDPLLARARARVMVAGVSLWPVLGGLRQTLARLATWSCFGALLYAWLALVLAQFPYTQPWGEKLGGYVFDVLERLGWAIVASLPEIFVVAVIFALTHAFARGVGAFFLAIEREEAAVPWFSVETARATRLLLEILIWLFAVAIAYPYIPGSETEAFKGVSVFLGVMISLGSAGLVNQIMSSLTIVYSHAFRRGDFVRIGEHEGRVQIVGLLSTRLEKASGEVVSIPNAVVTSTTTINSSPGERAAFEILATSVTIGYDAPWRQVHGLLLEAAGRVAELAPEPPPFVLQRSLSDFYVEYQLVVHLERRGARAVALSHLHSEIQDAFNEHGVQIMSPHYEGQPEEDVVVPRSEWFNEPAVRGDGRA